MTQPLNPMPSRLDARAAFGALALLALTCLCTSAQAQDAKAGQAAFAQCTACHSVDGTNGVGPSLQGVVGRKVGSFGGFRYSRAMKSTAYNWDAAKLDAYLADPQAAIPGNVMPFSGVPDKKERANLVAYLQTLK